MPTDHILQMLLTERDRLNRAIEALQGPTKRRGRPPKNAASVEAGAEPVTKRRRPKRSAAQRAAQSERMKKYWAQRRKGK